MTTNRLPTSSIILTAMNLKVALYFIPIVLIGLSVLLIGNHIYWSYAKRIRKKVDEQVKISMLSVALTMVPVIVLIAIIIMFTKVDSLQLVMLYGFTFFRLDHHHNIRNDL